MGRLTRALDLPVSMGWRHLLFANWPVDPDLVDAHLPDALSADTYDGDAWLSVVPLTIVAARPKGLPAPAGFRLLELNLRTYVIPSDSTDRSTGAEGGGVYFFSLDADGLLGVAGARLFHHLPYYYADSSLTRRGSRVTFTSRRRHPGARPCAFDADYEPVGEQYLPDPGSLAAFLTERYRYYTETPGGELRYAGIRHERWPLFDAGVDLRENGVFQASGFATPDRDPVFLYSPGVDVVASESRRVE